MKKKIPLQILLVIFVTLWSSPAFALSVSMEEQYTTGAPAIILLHDKNFENLDNYEIVIRKPNGSLAALKVRQESWNEKGEFFNVYTVDRDGTFEVMARNKVTHESAATKFSAGMFTFGSLVLYLITIAIFIVCMMYWFVKIRKIERKEAAE